MSDTPYQPPAGAVGKPVRFSQRLFSTEVNIAEAQAQAEGLSDPRDKLQPIVYLFRDPKRDRTNLYA